MPFDNTQSTDTHSTDAVERWPRVRRLDNFPQHRHDARWARPPAGRVHGVRLRGRHGPDRPRTRSPRELRGHLEVTVHGAPTINVLLGEVGLTDQSEIARVGGATLTLSTRDPWEAWLVAA